MATNTSDHQGELLFTLPIGRRPRYKTGFPLGDDVAEGGLFIYPDGEIRFWKPEEPTDDDVRRHPSAGVTVGPIETAADVAGLADAMGVEERWYALHNGWVT